MKTKKLVLWGLTVICIIVTVALWFAVKNDKPEYTEVEATVVSSETKYRKINGVREPYYEVEAKYGGEIYDLLNVHGSAAYLEGRQVTVYLSDGKLYADQAGVQTSTPLAKVYFVFLFLSIGMLIGTPSYLSSVRRKNTPRA